jgi:riboflavin biosynthesis pyrimidine reductase
MHTGMLAPPSPLLRVVLDARGTIVSGPLLDTTVAPTLVFTTPAAAPETLAVWRAAGVDVATVAPSASGGGVSLEAVMDELGRRGIIQLMVEGGAAVHTSFLRDGLVDELHVYKGSTVIGEGGRPWVTSPLAATIGDARFWALKSVRQLGNDAVMVYGRPDNAPLAEGAHIAMSPL